MVDKTPHPKYEDIKHEFVIKHDAQPGSWFGLPALKIQGKVFMAIWLNGDAIFKLEDPTHAEALALEGSVLFQPMHDRKPMREWVQVPEVHVEKWHHFASHAKNYVQRLATKKSK